MSAKWKWFEYKLNREKEILDVIWSYIEKEHQAKNKYMKEGRMDQRTRTPRKPGLGRINETLIKRGKKFKEEKTKYGTVYGYGERKYELQG